MNQNKQNLIKITFVQSPINQITDKLESVFCSQAIADQTSKFEMISKRLSENMKKIKQSQVKTNSSKKFGNFKQIKNSIISKDTQTMKLEIQQRINSIREKSSKVKQQRESTDNKEKNEEGNRELVSRKLFQEHYRSSEYLNKAKGHNSLVNCLNEIKEVKKTIKNIKQRCKNGPTDSYRKQKVQDYYLNSNSAKKRYVSHSGSKYNYTNYHDLSQKKLIELSDRRQRSQKQFNWISNPVPVKQFTIITGQQSAITSHHFTLE